VARVCGVNVSTVSRCLNDKGRVNEKTRERILSAVASLNYRPNRVARGLVTGRTHTVGLIVSDIRNPFFAEVARGAEDAAYSAGFDVVLCNSDLRPDKQISYIRSLAEKGVDGIIINYVLAMTSEQEKLLASYGIPIVLLDRPKNVTRLSSVSIDNFQGGFLAGSFLLKLGHRSLALLGGPEDLSTHTDRGRGFLEAVKRASPRVAANVFRGSQSFSAGYEMAWKMLTAHPETTAVFTSNDVMAFGALRALSEAGKKVPGDVSVIGFDNLDLCEMIQPPLTTIERPKYEMGKSAVELLLELIEAGRSHAPIHRVSGVRLVERQSTAAL
jgi:LacI family transcriptional regulator